MKHNIRRSQISKLYISEKKAQPLNAKSYNLYNVKIANNMRLLKNIYKMQDVPKFHQDAFEVCLKSIKDVRRKFLIVRKEIKLIKKGINTV